MNKINSNMLADFLAKKTGLNKANSANFINEFADIMRQTLEKNGIARVVGLGTFEVVDIEEKEQLDTNVSEKDITTRHKRVIFTPETTIKEQINKPFSQFETVIIGDNVNLNEIQSNTVKDEKEVIPAKKKEEKVMEEEGNGVIENVEEDVEVEENGKHRTTAKTALYVLAGTAAILLAFSAGVFLAMKLLKYDLKESSSNYDYDLIRDENVEKVSSVTDTIKSQPIVNVTKEEQNEVAEPVKKESDSKVDPAKYAALDVRIRTGAYNIVGTDREWVVKEGQTVESISRYILGPGMECYVETYNGLKPGEQVKVGETLLIPKLKLKKKSSKR